MSKVEITLNDQQVKLEKGLTKVGSLYESSDIDPDKKCLYLDKSDDIDVPLLPEDYIVIHGGEVIFSDDISSDIEDNPPVRHSVRFEFNGAVIEEGLPNAKINSDDICRMDEKLESSRLFVDMSGKIDDYIQDNTTLVVQEADSYFTIPSSDDDSIDLEECSKKDRKLPKGQRSYKIKVDREPYKTGKQKMTGSEILNLADKDYSEWSLNQKLRGGRRTPIDPEAMVDFAEPGIERFETVRKQAQQG